MSVSVDESSGALEKEVAAEAKTPARVKVPLDARARESRGQGVSGANVGGERDDKRDIDVSGALEKSAVMGGDVDADASARKAQTRDYVDAQTPKDVKKIAWQTADGSSERVTRKSSRSVKRAGVPASVAKANAEKASEDAALAKDTQIAQSSSVDKKKRAKARANGLAFLKADIPALTINTTTAGGEIVSTELKISPRTLAARMLPAWFARSCNRHSHPSESCCPGRGLLPSVLEQCRPLDPVPSRQPLSLPSQNDQTVRAHLQLRPRPRQARWH